MKMNRPKATVKSPEQILKMQRAGAVVAEVLAVCGEACEPGITTGELDDLAHETFSKRGAEGLFFGYPDYTPGQGYPRHTCISVNEEIVHGIPGDRIVRDGDIVSIDCGVRLDGWCADSARTFAVGDVASAHRQLIDVTRQCLHAAIDAIQVGRWWSDVGVLIEQQAEQAGYGLIREYIGHGLGREMHEEPRVPNYAVHPRGAEDFELREGLVIAIEPMLVEHSAETVVLADGWTVITADGGWAVHEEHTVAVTASGGLILTR